VNRCSSLLRPETMSFFAVSRFADRTDPDNVYALCPACAANPRRAGHRISAPASDPDAAER
jgi:hypothetical protein